MGIFSHRLFKPQDFLSAHLALENACGYSRKDVKAVECSNIKRQGDEEIKDRPMIGEKNQREGIQGSQVKVFQEGTNCHMQLRGLKNGIVLFCNHFFLNSIKNMNISMDILV